MTLRHLFYPLLFLKALLMIVVILFAGIGLGPDEAQYWTWSRNLDIGYYSKPPGIALQIYFSTLLFGATELGVRFSAVVMGTLLSIAVYYLARRAGSSQDISALAGLVTALSPVGIFSTFLAITDGGLLLFWTLALSELVGIPSYYRLGLYIGLGALFKWPIYLIWIIVAVLWLYKPEHRSRSVVAGVAISLLGLLPTLLWNSTHDFATFRHVFTTVQGAQEGNQGNPLAFIGSQIALCSPVFFALGCLAAFRINRCSPPIAFLAVVSISIIALYTGYSFFKKGQGNWCLFAYPPLFVWISSYWEKRYLFLGIVVSFLLVFGLFAFHKFLPWKMNPFRHNLGWDHLALPDFDPQKEFLVADKYQMTSILSFYNPHQTQGYFFNLLGTRKNQFSYWSPPEKGKNALFVTLENGFDYPSRLAPYFAKIGVPREVPLVEAHGQAVKMGYIIPCEHYLGQLPLDPEKF